MANFSIQLGRIEKAVIRAAVSAVNDATAELKDEIDANTPEKTGKLLSKNVAHYARIE